MSYTLSNTQDQYFLTNTGENIITYNVKKSNNCVDFLTIYDGTIQPDGVAPITFNNDGDYLIEITDGEVITERFIKYYLQLQELMIEDVKQILCGCGCGCGCDDCDDQDCNLFLSGKNKIDAFLKLVNPQLAGFQNNIYKETKCIIEKEIYCDINNEIYNGDTNYNLTLFRKLIALDYLVIYFFEKFSYCLQDDLCYVDKKFKVQEIFCCIEKLGIDINKLENIIENTMGTLTINNAAYINLPPSQVGDNTIAVDNRAITVLTLAMFTTNTTPVYTDPEGDAPDAVRIDTLPADGELFLNAVAVVAGQIIDVVDINNNLLTYESPDQDAFDSDSIGFSIRDVGSGQFSS